LGKVSEKYCVCKEREKEQPGSEGQFPRLPSAMLDFNSLLLGHGNEVGKKSFKDLYSDSGKCNSLRGKTF